MESFRTKCGTNKYGFLRLVVQTNYHWMSEPSNTTFAQHNVMGRCMISDGNHPNDKCIYISEWQNYQNHSMYNKQTYFPDPYFPSYLPFTYDLHQEPEPSEEDKMIDMLKDWFKKHNEKLDTLLEIFQNQFESIQRQSISIQRITYQTRQLTENQSYIPQ